MEGGWHSRRKGCTVVGGMTVGGCTLGAGWGRTHCVIVLVSAHRRDDVHAAVGDNIHCFAVKRFRDSCSRPWFGVAASRRNGRAS